MPFQYNPVTNSLDLVAVFVVPPGTVASLAGNDAISVGPDGGGTIGIIGNNASGINITQGGLNSLSVSAYAASNTQAGTLETATNAEAAAQASTVVALTPSNVPFLFSTTPLSVPQGGTGVVSFSANQLILGNGGGNLSSAGAMGNGQLLIGNLGNPPSIANLTSTGGTVIITNGAGTINLESNTAGTLTFSANIGSATPAAGTINFLGSMVNGVQTSGAANTITISGVQATNAQVGISRYATNAETVAGVINTASITPASLDFLLGTQTTNSIPYSLGPSSQIGWMPAGLDGQIPIGASFGAPMMAYLTAGANVSITTGPNAITISASFSGSWTQKLLSFTAVPNSRYIINSFGPITVTMPTPGGYLSGVQIDFLFETSNSTTIQCNANQVIYSMGVASSNGGTMTTTQQYSGVSLIYVGGSVPERWIMNYIQGSFILA